MNSWREVYDFIINELRNSESSEAIATRIIEHFSGEEKLKAFLGLSNPNGKHINELETFLKQLKEDKPIQYILGFEYFMGLKINVNPDVLIPRPETEELVMLSKKFFKNSVPKTAIDFCTGSGCIALGLKKIFPSSKIFASDISQGALETAKLNAELNFGNQHSIEFLEQDILKEKSTNDLPKIDLIISNPPYITEQEADSMSKNVLEYEPHIALFTGSNDPIIFYKALLNIAKEKLSKNGVMLCEINPLFCEELVQMGEESNFNSQIHLDIIGKKRFISFQK